MVTASLLKKELKQNAVIFLAPYLFLVIIIALNRQNSAWLPSQWTELLAVSLPLAMAGAYGLQAFDLEENGHTKDFLVTKPLTVRQIVWTKYLGGLGVLLPLTMLWLGALLPQSLVGPNFDNLNSFWLTLFLMIAVILYSACFLAGVLIKGPVKLFAGIVLGIAALGWSGLVWCAGLTTLFYTNLERFPTVALGLVYLLSLLLIGFFLKICIELIFQILKNTFSWKTSRKAFTLTLITLIVLPSLFWLGNRLSRPVICPFVNLAHSLSTSGDWFIGLEGSRQPAGQLTALTDARGRLGIAAPFSKPQVVYVSNGTRPLRDINWSPDGRSVTFVDNRQLKLYSLATKTARNLGPGSLALWSRDSRQLLVGKEIKDQTAPPAAPAPLRRLSLTAIDPQHPGNSRAVTELYTNDLALTWDSASNNLFAINHQGVLTIINLHTGSTQKIALLPPKQKESVFFGKIASPDSQSSTYAFILCSFDPAQTGRHKAYTIRWYDLDQKIKKISLIKTINNCSYKDIIISRQDHSLLARNYGNGIYRQIKVESVK